MIPLILLLLSPQEGPVGEYWRFLGDVGLYSPEPLSRSLPRCLTAEEDAAFRKAHAVLVQAMGQGAPEEELRRGLIDGDPDALRALARRDISSDLKAVALASVDLEAALSYLPEASPEFRIVAGYICRAVLGLYFEALTAEQRHPIGLEAAVGEIVGGEPDFVAGYLRLASDRVFLTHMKDPQAKGPRGSRRKDLSVDESNLLPYLAQRGLVQPELLNSPAVWAAWVRAHVEESRENADRLEEAIAQDPDNAYFEYLRSYFASFARQQQGWDLLVAANRKAEYRPYLTETMNSLAAAHTGPLRFYFAIRECNLAHAGRFHDMLSTYADMRLASGAEAHEVLDAVVTMVERVLGAAVHVHEMKELLSGFRNGPLSRGRLLLDGDHAGYLDLQRRIAGLERDLLILQSSLSYPSEFEFLAAGLLLPPDLLEDRWKRGGSAGFDRKRLRLARQRYEGEVLARLMEGGAPPEEAQAKFEAGDFRGAARLCDEALDRSPDDVHALELKRRALGSIGGEDRGGAIVWIIVSAVCAAAVLLLVMTLRKRPSPTPRSDG